MPSDDVNPNFKTYLSLGLRPLEETNGEAICRCEFCGKDKLYINKEEGLFDCKVCSISGNKYVYMKHFMDFHSKEMKGSYYTTLSKARGNLPAEAFTDAGLFYVRGEKWYIPIFNTKGVLVNLRSWDGNIMKHLAGCRAALYGEEVLNRYKKIYICEGEWDAIALRWLLKELHLDDVGVVAVPGCDGFKAEWAAMFENKDVTLLFDNDDPGKKGMKRTYKILLNNGRCNSLKIIKWDEIHPNKYDIRDVICSKLKYPQEAYDLIQSYIIQPDEDYIEDGVKIIKTSLQDVLQEYGKVICLSPEIEHAVTLTFATIFSTRMKDSPLWLFIVGPSGGGKTMTLQAAAESEHTVYMSSLSRAALISGSDVDGEDPSLIPKLIGKTLILKEFTELLALPPQEQELIFSTLRGAYDGEVKKKYAKVLREYKDCHFSIVAGVTNAIHGFNHAHLGERFLKFQMSPENLFSLEILQAAVNSVLAEKVPEKEMQKIAKQFIDYKMAQPFNLVEMTPATQHKIICLAQLVGIIRAQVERDSKGDLVYRPVAEVGTRIAKQLVKLAQSVAFTMDHKEITPEVYKLTKRLALDTAYSWNRDVMLQIASYPEGLTTQELMDRAKIKSVKKIEQVLEDMYELKAIDFYIQHDGSPGRPARRWVLTNYLKTLFEQSEVLSDDILSELPGVPGEIDEPQAEIAKSS